MKRSANDGDSEPDKVIFNVYNIYMYIVQLLNLGYET